jgi:peptidoglycan/xylan/chitin deacetylase (PgdA/CDA1 family)
LADSVIISRSSSARLAKRALSNLLDRTGLLRLDATLRQRDSVVAVHYHSTPAYLADNLQRHLEFYRERFECLDEDGLLDVLSGARSLRRPGIVISFDDGVRDHAEVAADLLDRLRLCGWFMLPGGFLDDPSAFHSEYLDNAAPKGHSQAPPMTWDMARQLVQRGHVVGCHTWSHCVLGRDASDAMICEEVDDAKQRLEARLGRQVRTFAWVRGRAEDYSAGAHRAVSERFDLAFMSMARAIRPGDDPFTLHRFGVEASFPLVVLRFQISRFNEAFFARRRAAVEAAVMEGP